MNFVFDNERPIYVQLVEQFKLQIISGKLELGSRMLSVRDLSLQLKVNPNTLQKALAELEEAKLIYTERTNGKFVTNDERLIKEMKEELAKKKVQTYLSDMEKLGISKQEATKYLEDLGGK